MSFIVCAYFMEVHVGAMHIGEDTLECVYYGYACRSQGPTLDVFSQERSMLFGRVCHSSEAH